VTETDFFRIMQNNFPKYAVMIEREPGGDSARYTVAVEVGPMSTDVTGSTLLLCFEELLDHLGL